MTNLKLRVIQKVLPILTLLTIPILLFGQSANQILQRNVENAKFIIEGKVIAKKSLRIGISGEIQTANKIFIQTKIKGIFHTDTIEVYTIGGTIDGKSTIVSHTAKLNINEQGIFLLNTDSHSHFTIANGKQGKLRRLFNDSKAEAYHEGTNEKYKSWRQIKEQIGQWSGNDLTITSITNKEELLMLENNPELCIKIKNVIPSIQNSTLEFDLMIKSNVAGLPFANREVFIDYPIAHLGANIVVNQKIQVTKEIVTADEDYVLSVDDINNDRMKMNFETTCLSGENYYILGTEFEKLAHITLDVQNWGNQGSMILDDLSGTAKYYLAEDGCLEFNDICYGGSIGFAACQVTSVEVAPYGAGVGQTVTITGQDFGTTAGIGSKLTIPNPDDGGSTSFDISGNSIFNSNVLQWTNTTIELELSSFNSLQELPVGSGTWQIDPDINSTDPNTLVCFFDIEIDYALYNLKNNNDNDKMIGIAQNPTNSPNGDYQWYIDLDIDSDPVLQLKGITFNDVETIAIQAFCDWEMITGINYEYMGGISGAAIGGAAKDDKKTILSFANLSTPAFTRTRFSGFPCDDDILFTERFQEADIQLDRATDWFFSTGTTGIEGTGKMDMYSIMIHEIGHACLFGHSMDLEDNSSLDSRIMYFGVMPEQIKRDIDDKTKTGFDLLLARTIDAMQPGRCFAGTALNTSPTGCTTPIHHINKSDCRNILKSNMIHKGEMMEFEINSNNFGIFNIYSPTGIRVYSSNETQDGYQSISTSTFKSGIYFLQYECKGILKTEKFLIY